ncbi:hypothetical protein DBR27_20790 [Flavobacterium sp. HMWF030]|nr:hypothetical protein DBR27_20790 [Flavobacterium sp. HMWF030]
MKNSNVLFLTFILMSCNKADTINHYLTKSITQKELENNGFYKYSFTATLDDEDKIDDTIKSVARYDMYSNVKPEINENSIIMPYTIMEFSS